jgi:diguanylate cyclase (GGDEF)-like protein
MPRLLKTPNGVTGFLIDIDNFGDFQQPPNTFREGSKLIKQVARVLSGCATRPDDFLVKYGGDEFLVILGDTPISGGQKLADIIQDKMAKEHFT